MKKHLISIQALNYGISHTKTINRKVSQYLNWCFKEGETGGGVGEIELKEMGEGLTKKIMELKGMEVLKDLPGAITDLQTMKASLEALEKKHGKAFESDSEFGKFKSETNKALLDIAAALEQTPKENKEKGTKSFLAEVKEAFEMNAEYKGILEKPTERHGWAKMEIKAVVTESMLATIQAGATQTSLTTNTGFISKIRHRILTYLANITIGQIGVDKPTAMWIEEQNEQGVAVFIAEGSAKTQLSVLYVEKTMTAQKIAVYGKVTLEFLKNLPQLVSYVQNNLLKRLDIATEDGLFSGLGSASTQLQGLFTYAVPFTGGGVTGVSFVNEMDVMNALGIQCQNAFHVPSGIFVSIALMGKLQGIKSTIGTPLFPYDTDWANVSFGGMKLIPTAAFNNLVNGNRLFVGGDLTVINVAFLENMNIQIGLDGNDFTQNKKTILLEQILVQFVSANDVNGLIQGNFDTAQALIG